MGLHDNSSFLLRKKGIWKLASDAPFAYKAALDALFIWMRITTMALNSLHIDKSPADTRVVVAMSGGVDSSVVAAMLKDEGYDVVGITLQLYDHGAAVQKKGACCAGQDIHDARRVAESIGIPHYVLNYENRFQQSVIDDFVDTYLAGETPIPCVKCNQTVKFKDLLATARDLGADVMATGHYVRREQGEVKAELHRGQDQGKDQSYFLFATTQEQLDFLRFPLGAKTKSATRELAKKYGLTVQDKPDSQDICFVPSGGYASVIEKLRPGALEPGEIVHVDSGEVLGAHDGIAHYTVGQRKGLGISSADPLYVVKLDVATQRVYVGARTALLQQQVLVRNMNWIADVPLSADPRKVQVKLRSLHQPVEALVVAEGEGGACITLAEPESAVSPGQACVIYDGDRLLGGGWITR